jgi:hypothetical protein
MKPAVFLFSLLLIINYGAISQASDLQQILKPIESANKVSVANESTRPDGFSLYNDTFSPFEIQGASGQITKCATNCGNPSRPAELITPDSETLPLLN